MFLVRVQSMPGNLNAAVVSPSNTVLPPGLNTAYVESRIFPMLGLMYHDGRIERSLRTDYQPASDSFANAPQPIRMWRLARRLIPADHATLLAFWTAVGGGLRPFYYYDPYDVVIPNPIGSNYDATGGNTQGRVKVRFTSPGWSESIGLTLVDVPDLSLIEVA